MWIGERCGYLILLSVVYFVFWGYVTGVISRMFSEPKCIIPDEDMEKLVQNEIAEHHPEVKQYLHKMSNNAKESDDCPWPPLKFEGRKKIDRNVYDWDFLEAKFDFMEDGHYLPTECIPHQSVAIIVFVYKDVESEKQFQMLINNILPKLHRQQLEFSIYVVRQQRSDLPNRGLLFNIGFQHAIKDMKYDCVVLHDVDVLPEDDRNYYHCRDYPRHMSKRIEINNYKSLHKDWCGGIISMRTEHYKRINGWSNMYFGNKKDNDDIFRRIVTNYDLVRTEDRFSYCSSTSNTTDLRQRDGCWMFEVTGRTWQMDGLNTTQYEKLERHQRKLFTLFDIDINTMKVRGDYMNRTRSLINYDILPNATLTLNNIFCEQLLGRKLDMNKRLLA